MHATTTSDLLANNMDISSTVGNTENSSTVPQKEEQQSNVIAVKNFQNAFCGVFGEAARNSKTNGYITEYTLPQSCEMPLGIAVDKNDAKVWYVSTKRGILGSYDLRQNKFDQEHIIPLWNSRQDQTGFSQVWSVKIADNNNNDNDNNNNTRRQTAEGVSGGDIWFTDAQQNSIWRYNKKLQLFEMYKIPARSSSFGTIYPISLEFNSKGNKILFAGTYSHSIWIGDILNMRNGTSDGISQVTIPIDNTTTFSGIDPLYITVGSLAADNKRNSVWVSVFSYGNRGEIFRYNLESQSFDRKFDLPAELNSPVGIVVDNDNKKSSNLWITNGGTSIFYNLNTNNGKITKFVTSKISPRVFGQGLFDNFTKTKVQNNIGSGGSVSSNNHNISKNAYTLPYWIKVSSDGSIWFNEQEGNKIGRFNPHDMTLIEYWVPSQNRLWGSCSSTNSHGDDSNGISNNNANIANNSANDIQNISTDTNDQLCGIANVLQFSLNTETHSHDNDDGESKHTGKGRSIWFTEWSENKIGKVDANEQLLPFSVAVPSIPPNKEITIKRGESKEVKVKVIPEESSSFSTISGNMNIHMVASSTFTPTGDFGNSTASFSEEWLLINTKDDNSNHIVSFAFTPSIDLKPGQYTMMIGAENDAVTYLRGIKLRII
jgi:virginiamycin B lyase